MVDSRPDDPDRANTGNLWFHGLSCVIWLGGAIAGFVADVPSVFPWAFLVVSGWFGLNLALGLRIRVRRRQRG